MAHTLSTHLTLPHQHTQTRFCEWKQERKGRGGNRIGERGKERKRRGGEGEERELPHPTDLPNLPRLAAQLAVAPATHAGGERDRQRERRKEGEGFASLQPSMPSSPREASATTASQSPPSIAPQPRCVAVENRDAKERRPRVTVLEAFVVTVQSRCHRHHRRLLLLLRSPSEAAADTDLHAQSPLGSSATVRVTGNVAVITETTIGVTTVSVQPSFLVWDRVTGLACWVLRRLHATSSCCIVIGVATAMFSGLFV
ncbi:uncharacterized protein DS421_14g473690 [Arachis hypogaea]|nr:uncharacterized protein DS421_14g473690 [Arachis hypogaea]